MQAKKMNRFAIAMLQVERATRHKLPAPNCNTQVQQIVDAERKEFMAANQIEPVVLVVEKLPPEPVAGMVH